MNLRNKIALISGGARMGNGIGIALAKRGCTPIFGYRRSKNQARESVEMIRSVGGRADSVPLDVSRPGAAEKAVATIKQKFGGLDIVINMASVYKETRWSKISEAVWRDNLDANLTGGFRLIRAASAELRRRQGRVVNFSDWLAVSGRPRYADFVPYYVAKKAVAGLTEALALELAPDVLVNAIAPGPILPPSGMSTKEKAAVAQATPLRKWGGVDAIAQAVIFLCETDFVTGECLRVDGGRHLY
jgi:NAD(P)-dependent dehydrogenase (short-subunit alcohol dehydrogenase family)